MKSLNVKYLKHGNGDLYAALYDEARPTYNGMLTMYSHIGQHSEGSISYVLGSSDAQSHEYKELHEELTTLYNHLRLDVINENASIDLSKVDTEDIIFEVRKRAFELTESDKLDLLQEVLLPNEWGITVTQEDELRNILNKF
jgi:hypothetical protein